jgi:replicative DNA helicase
MEDVLTDLSAERAVLAGVCHYGAEGYVDVGDLITTNTFTDELHQLFYKCITNIFKDDPNVKGVDLASIYSSAKSIGVYNLVSDPVAAKLIRGIIKFPINLSNVRKLAAKIKKLEIARQGAICLEEAKNSVRSITGDESIDEIRSRMEAPIYEFTTELSNTQSDGPELMGEGSDEHFQQLIDHPVDMMGISTGYPYYDMAIGGGLRPGTVNLIGARPKIGKTVFAMNVSLHIAGKLGLPVLILDTEMVKRDQRSRMWANLSEVTINEIETGRFAENSWKRDKVELAKEHLKSIPLHYLNISGKPFDETLSIMRRWVTRYVGLDDNGVTKPCAIVYDYLKLMDAGGLSKNLQEYQALGFQITSLHNFMVRYQVPCLSFIQLNRDGITKEETDAASGSDRLIWLCSNFSIFKPLSEEDTQQYGNKTVNRKLSPIVARHGEGLSDGDYILMNFKRPYAKIIEISTLKTLEHSKRTTQEFEVHGETDGISFSGEHGESKRADRASLLSS